MVLKLMKIVLRSVSVSAVLGLVKNLACFNGKFMGARAPHETFRD